MYRRLCLCSCLILAAGGFLQSAGAQSACTNDPLVVSGAQWNVDGSEQSIGCPEDWNYVYGEDVSIAIIGDGVQYDRQDFEGKYVGGYNFQNPGSPPFPAAPGRMHETACASIALALTHNKRLMAGVAGGWAGHPLGCKLYVVRLVDGFQYWNVADGIDKAADAGCKVISLSLGYTQPYEDLRLSVLRAYSMGANVVAGKNYNWITCTPQYPADFQDRSRVTAVGAYGMDGYRCRSGAGGNCGAHGSGCGHGIDMIAPGYNLVALDNTPDGYLTGMEGTSFAIPHVSGAVGLVRSWLGEWSRPEDAEWILKYSASDPPDSSDGSNWTWDPYYGHGRLRVSEAFAQLSELTLTQATAKAKNWSSFFAPTSIQFKNDLGGPLNGTYTAYPYIVWSNVTYEQSYQETPYVWGVGDGSTGWDTTRPQYQLGYCEVREGSQTATGCTLQAFVFSVYIPTQQKWVFYPCNPKDVVFSYRVWGALASAPAPLATVGSSVPGGDLDVRSGPSPFGEFGWFDYSVPATGDVALSICDVTGRQIRTLVDTSRNPGSYRVVWDGKDDDGARVPGGIYFYRLAQGDDQVSRKMVVVK
jgi:subtilisin family serine protease